MSKQEAVGVKARPSEALLMDLARITIKVAEMPHWMRGHWSFDEAALQAQAVRARAILAAAAQVEGWMDYNRRRDE